MFKSDARLKCLRVMLKMLKMSKVFQKIKIFKRIQALENYVQVRKSARNVHVIRFTTRAKCTCTQRIVCFCILAYRLFTVCFIQTFFYKRKTIVH